MGCVGVWGFNFRGLRGCLGLGRGHFVILTVSDEMTLGCDFGVWRWDRGQVTIMWAILRENVEQPRFFHFPKNSEVFENFTNLHV